MSTVEAVRPPTDATKSPDLPSLTSAYRAVFASWRVLVPVVLGQATVVIVGLIASWLALDAIATVNGRPEVPGPALAVLTLATSVSTLHIGAGAVLAALRGQTVRRVSLRQHAGSVPVLLLPLYAALTVLLVMRLALPAAPQWVPVAALLVLVVCTYLTCWLALVGADEGIRGRSALGRVLRLARAAGWGTWRKGLAGSILLPGLILLAGYTSYRLVSDDALVGGRWPAVGLAALALLVSLSVGSLTVLLVGASIAVGYQRAVIRSAPAAVDGTRVDSPPPAPVVTRRQLSWRFAVGAVLLLASVVAVAVNPRGATEINVVSLPDSVLAIGLPAGQPPVLATGSAVLDCKDDACARYDRHPLSKALSGGNAVDAAIAGDGSVFFLIHDFGAAQLRLARCGRTGDCQDGAMVADLSAVTFDSMDGGTHLTGAIGLSPGLQNADGPIGVVTVVGAFDDYRISVLSCVDIRCEGSTPHDFGGIGRFDGPDADVFSVLVDGQGLPTVGYKTESHDVFIGSCESAACASPQLTQLHTGSPDAADNGSLLALALLGGQPVVYDRASATPAEPIAAGRLVGCTDARCAGSAQRPTTGTWIGPALAVTEQTLHTAVIIDGRLVVESCVADACDQTSLIELTGATEGRLAIAVDGRRMISYRTDDHQVRLLSYA